MSPDLADIGGLSDSDTTTTNRLTNAILQGKTVELITWTTTVNVVSKAWA